MKISVFELARARELVAELLEQLRLEAYLFELEPRQDDWAIKVECAIDEGWEEVRLCISREELSRLQADDEVRAAVLGKWRERLAACKCSR